MQHYDVYGIGNALVDTEYEVEDEFLAQAKLPKGIMTLIEESDRQRLIKLLEQDNDNHAVKHAGGGSAANTMVVIAQLGGNAFYSCKVAADSTGDFFVSDLKAAGIATNLSEDREQGATGQCISMVTPDAERTMTTCLGITNFLSTSELDPKALGDSKYLYIEGYLVSSVTGFQAALEAQRIAHENNVEVSLTLSDPAMVENFKANYELLLSNGVDLLFCNLDEARLLTGSNTLDECIEALKEIAPRFAITCGKDGAVAFDGTNIVRSTGVPTVAVDTTGAGDIFAGAFLIQLSRGNPFKEALQLANKAASLLVSRFGARLTQAEVDVYLEQP